MPNRIIKESICTSDTVDALTWFEEVLFYRLIVNCDDYGRYGARPAIIRGKLFPLKDVTVKQVNEAIIKLSTVGIAKLYEVDGRPYLQLCTWADHQSIRAKKSKFPAPDVVHASEINCMQMHADDSKCARNPIQSESNPNPGSESKTRETRFGEFWAAYPRKQGKGAAEKAWGKIKPNAEVFDQIMNAVESQKHCEQWQKHNGQFIPNPATWLNQRRWEDEPGTPSEGETDNIFLQMLREGGEHV